MKRTKKFTEAEKTIELELKKELGEEVKILLDKVDIMVAQKKKRGAIEAMMVAEIARYTRNLHDRPVFVT